MTPSSPSPRSDQVYFNGIDADTGTYAVAPMSIDELAKRVRGRPGVEATVKRRGDVKRAFALPPEVDSTDLTNVGWGIVFASDTPANVREALAPLIALRQKQAGELFKLLDYQKGEPLRDWYTRHQIAVASFDPSQVPYYLLLVGSPASILFEFQYLLGIEYAAGRLAFDSAPEYAQYARSVVAYETGATGANRKEIVYWGTCHAGDPATNMSASLLVEPLANGLPGSTSLLKNPVHVKPGYARKLFLRDEAVRDALLGTLHAEKPPAVLFTASHGMSVKAGKPNQVTDNGGLLCQDWPGFGGVKREHYLAGADVGDDANVSGLIAFLFACFGAGTPDADQFLMDLSQVATAPPLAPQPFVAALPRRLLAHPRGSALAVIGHVDRAWSFSIQPVNTSAAHIETFRSCLSFILQGSPVGHAVALPFGQRFTALSTLLLSATSPTAPEFARPSDSELVSYWLERNDAQNYVLLGDPAVRIRKEQLS
jgi:hypothetical protein